MANRISKDRDSLCGALFIHVMIGLHDMIREMASPSFHFQGVIPLIPDGVLQPNGMKFCVIKGSSFVG